MKNLRFESLLIALALVVLGMFIHSGLTVFSDKERVVTVKGLAEMQVPADRVTWPIVYRNAGNELAELYRATNAAAQEIVAFLKANGVTDEEISVNPTDVFDSATERYASETRFRYNASVVVTVTSNRPDFVRKLIEKQGELVQKGIVVSGGDDYRYRVTYEYTQLNAIKPKMIEEATQNAREAAQKFAKDSNSTLGKIKAAHQGQFSIEDRDANTPYIKNVRVVTTVVYFLQN